MGSVCLLTGLPGVGKTTVIRQTLNFIKIKAGGFYTEEIRTSAGRQGFKIVTLDGREGILAHVDFRGFSRVGKYGVDIRVLESIGVKAILDAVNYKEAVIIDEIGKMELLSNEFREAVKKVVFSEKKLLATIMFYHHPFADELKRLSHVKIIEVTRGNRDELARKIATMLDSKNETDVSLF